MTHDVIIAGAGTAGLMLACELGLAGVRPLLLEARDEPRMDAPGVAINPGTVEHLDQRGLMADLRPGAMVLPTEHFGFLTLPPHATAPHENTHLVWQPGLEQHLERRATELGATIRRGYRVTGLDRTADGVRLTVEGPGGRSTLDGRFLVGCDGADSTVRQLAGIPAPEVRGPFHGIVGDVEIDFSELAPQLIGVHHLPSGSHVLGAPLGEGLFRVMLADFGSDADEQSPVDLEELVDSVYRLTGLELKAQRARWLARYGNRTHNAERYSDGAVYLLGDAAHRHYPFNGLGIGTAVHDAANLGWKLAAVLNGWAPEGLLDTYHAERHPVGQAAGDIVRAEVAVCYPPETVAPVRALLTDLIAIEPVRERLFGAVSGTDVRYPPADPAAHPLVGRRLPPAPLETPDGPSSVAQLLHAGRGVLVEFGDGPGYQAGLTGFADRVNHVHAAASPHVPAAAVLLRPDGHVAWAADAGADGAAGQEQLRTALATWFGAPTGA